MRQAYDTVSKILPLIQGTPSGSLVMGLDPRYVQLVRTVLKQQRSRGLQPRFFEVGYGSGVLLHMVAEWGIPTAGIEVSAELRRQACELLGPGHESDLLLGSLVTRSFSRSEHRYTLIYWNDVFEHIPPDEILDYLREIHELLVPGGQLITITPNWHIRPSDVTSEVCAARTEAAGLHLKEYTLGEVTALLHRAGFASVAVPLFLTYRRIVLCGDGLAALKQFLEPALEWLPFRMAQILCRGFGLCMTVATRSAQGQVGVEGRGTGAAPDGEEVHRGDSVDHHEDGGAT